MIPGLGRTGLGRDEVYPDGCLHEKSHGCLFPSKKINRPGADLGAQATTVAQQLRCTWEKHPGRLGDVGSLVKSHGKPPINGPFFNR